MEHERKIIIVPKETYNRIMKHQKQHLGESSNGLELQTTQTKGDNLSCLVAEIHDILFSKSITHEREKCQKYSQILRRSTAIYYPITMLLTE